uniref:Uncharacterized protein n=1 Tax=Mycena chlorophos TaxID=658473 RepID=A0ABQ0LWD4_MYCCL|nr:predicted protein [Mycena chlorophos]
MDMRSSSLDWEPPPPLPVASGSGSAAPLRRDTNPDTLIHLRNSHPLGSPSTGYTSDDAPVTSPASSTSAPSGSFYATSVTSSVSVNKVPKTGKDKGKGRLTFVRGGSASASRITFLQAITTTRVATHPKPPDRERASVDAVPVRVVGRGGSGSRARSLSVGTTQAMQLAHARVRAQQLQLQLDPNAPVRMVGRGGMGSKRRELAPASMPPTIPEAGQSPAAASAASGSVQTPSAARKTVPPPAADDAVFHRPTGRGGAGSRPRKPKPKPGSSTASSPPPSRGLLLLFKSKRKLPVRSTTMATYGPPSVDNVNVDRRGSIAHRRMSTFDSSSLYSAVEFAPAGIPGPSRAPTAAPRTTRLGLIFGAARYQNPILQDPDPDFDFVDELEGEDVVYEHEQQSVHRHPFDADSTFTSDPRDSVYTTSSPLGSEYGYAYAYSEMMSSSEMDGSGMSSSATGSGSGLRTPHDGTSEQLDITIYELEEGDEDPDELRDWQEPAELRARAQTPTRSRDPLPVLRAKATVPSTPFEDSFIDIEGDVQTPDTSSISSSHYGHGWTGEWNRGDIRDVIGALRELKF